MLKSIKRFFDNLSPTDQQSPEEREHASHLAVAVLLVEMSRMDGNVSDDEIAEINHLLKSQFQLSPDEKKELTRLAKQRLDNSTDYYQFTSVINQNFDHAQKINLIKHLWRVAFADNQINPHEEHFLRKIHSLLHVSHSDFINAKLKAKTE